MARQQPAFIIGLVAAWMFADVMLPCDGVIFPSVDFVVARQMAALIIGLGAAWIFADVIFLYIYIYIYIHIFMFLQVDDFRRCLLRSFAAG